MQVNISNGIVLVHDELLILSVHILPHCLEAVEGKWQFQCGSSLILEDCYVMQGKTVRKLQEYFVFCVLNVIVL